jgi:thiosulfate dehydrogenase
MNRNKIRKSRAYQLLVILTSTAATLVAQGAGQGVRISNDKTQPQPHTQTRALAEPATSLPIARTWMPPDPGKIPAGPQGESILLGMRIFMETPKYASAYVGDQLSCSNCHLQGGTMGHASPVVGAPSWFPAFSERAKRNITLEDRIQECVTRSENGTPLAHGGPEMTGLLSYMEWISQQAASNNVTVARGLTPMPDMQGDPVRGARVYKDKCSTCHGDDGAGVPGILPALWGSGAYNDGAGMNQVKKMAAFVFQNMPQSNPGSLTPQQAFDVSAFVASKPHSHYNSAYDIY